VPPRIAYWFGLFVAVNATLMAFPVSAEMVAGPVITGGDDWGVVVCAEM
jgi:hypothetical protein